MIFLVFLLESFCTYVLGSAVVRKLVESELSPSSCATEQVLENNKLSRSVFEVLVCIGLNNKEHSCVTF